MRLRKIHFSDEFITLNFSALLGPSNEKANNNNNNTYV